MVNVDAFTSGRQLRHGGWSVDVIDGALRTIRWRCVEVVRGIACPIRDENWGTHIEQVLAESADEHGYTRAFTLAEGKLHGRLTAQFVGAGTLRVVLELRAMHAIRANRAGFTVLHPIASTTERRIGERWRPDCALTRAR